MVKVGNSDPGVKMFKLGHGGTLDMEATGVLTVGIGRGCSCLPAFLSGKKRYLSTGKLGIETDTLNAEGKIIGESPYGHVTKEALCEAMLGFEGEFEQVPPIFSALKRKGKRLSDLARAGEEVTPYPRKVKVHHLKCLDFSPPHFTIDVCCGGGFYVRKLIQDLGHAVGSCAHLVELERTQHGPFTTDTAIPTGQWNISTVLQAVQHNRNFIKDFVENAREKHKNSQHFNHKSTRTKS